MLPLDQSFIQGPKFSILYNMNCITLLLCMSLSTENIFFLAFLLNLNLQTAGLCHLCAFYPTVTYTPYLLYLSSLHVFFIFFFAQAPKFFRICVASLEMFTSNLGLHKLYSEGHIASLCRDRTEQKLINLWCFNTLVSFSINMFLVVNQGTILLVCQDTLDIYKQLIILCEWLLFFL